MGTPAFGLMPGNNATPPPLFAGNNPTGGVGGASAAEEARRERITTTGPMWIQTLKEHLSAFGPSRLKPLFATKKMGWTTAIVWFLWIDIQIGIISRDLLSSSIYNV